MATQAERQGAQSYRSKGRSPMTAGLPKQLNFMLFNGLFKKALPVVGRIATFAVHALQQVSPPLFCFPVQRQLVLVRVVVPPRRGLPLRPLYEKYPR